MPHRKIEYFAIMSIIPEHLVEEVRNASDIVDVVSDYLSLKKSGRNFFGLCPFHPEKTPSFSVNPEKQIFHCFGCGTGGNVFTFVMQEEGVNFPEAVRILAKRAGIEIPEPDEQAVGDAQQREALYYANELAQKFYHERLFAPEGKAALDYLHGRGFTDEGIRAFGLGYAPDAWDALVNHALGAKMKPEVLQQAGLLNERESGGYYDRFRHRLMFPIANLSGKIVAFGGRRLDEDEKSPKYINSPESPIYHKSSVLYGLYQGRDAIREAGEAIFVEGYTDVMRLYLAGIKNVVATSGTSLTDLHARLINRYTAKVVLLYDSDTAGAAATMRGADILLAQNLEVRVAELEEGEDPDSFVQKHGAAPLREKLAQALPLLDFKALRIPEAAGHLDRSERIRSLVASLAQIQDGLQRQQMVHHYAENMKLDEEILWEEVRRLRKLQRLRHRRGEATTPSVPVGQQKSFAERSRIVEEELLRIMLHHQEAIPFVFSFMEVSDFHNEDYQLVAAVLFEFFKNGVHPEPEELMHYFTDPKISQFISRIVLQEPLQGGVTRDYRRWAADCLAKLQQLMVDTKIADVQQQLREREKSGGETSELMQTWKSLQEQRKRIQAKNFLPREEE